VIAKTVNRYATQVTSGFLNVLSLFLLVLVVVIAIYAETVWSMVAIWGRSETFAHCYFILPAVIYLLWICRNDMDASPEPNIGLATLIFPLSFLWLLAAMADVGVAAHFSVVAMSIVGTVSLLGWKLSRNILFPMGFLLMSVPVGEELVPIMIDFTADFTVGAVRALGLPVYREGTYFSLPTGRWSVVEACSGVRYLIASVTIGLLYAYLTYTSSVRRFLFVLVSIVVPIVANGLRAVMIVLLGHYSDMKIATGVDHLLYGWLFFGVVIFLMFWIGSFWREDVNASDGKTATITSLDNKISGSLFSRNCYITNLKENNSSLLRFGMVSVVILFVLLSGPYWLKIVSSPLDSERIRMLESSYANNFDLLTPQGYSICDSCTADYAPLYKDADISQAIHLQSSVSDKQISFYREAYFSWSNQGEMISSANFPVSEEDDNRSVRIDRSTVEIKGGASVTREIITGRQKHLIYYWQTVGGRAVDFDVEGKILESILKLGRQPFQSQFIVVAAPFTIAPDEVEKDLISFLEKNARQFGLL